MADGATSLSAQVKRLTVHPFFSTKSPSPSIAEPSRSPVDVLLQRTVHDIGELAAVSGKPKNSRRFSLIDSLDWSKLAPASDTAEDTSPESPPQPSVKTVYFPLESTTPLAPAYAAKIYRKYLTPYELSEILGFKEVYFLGLRAEKVKCDDLLPNSGFDDDNSDYRVVLGDHIHYRFEVLECVGRGAFAKVLKCYDHKLKEHVAVKVIKNSRRFVKQVQSEVAILNELQRRECHSSITLKETFTFRDHFCMTFELMESSLYDELKRNHFTALPLAWVREVARQLVRTLVQLKAARIVHCDIKPENILLRDRSKSEICLVDFGSACFDGSQNYTYIQSRFYRAPEVILGCKYSHPIDMWSVGCVVAELVTGRPLFPGENEKDQLMWIMSAIGVPPRELRDHGSKASLFFTSSGEPRITPNSSGVRRLPNSLPLQKCLPEGSTPLMNFISSCLQWDPEERLTPELAERHPFLVRQRATF